MLHLNRDSTNGVQVYPEILRLGRQSSDWPTKTEVARDKKEKGRRFSDFSASRRLLDCPEYHVIDGFGRPLRPTRSAMLEQLPEDALGGTRIPRKSAPHFQREPKQPRDSQINNGEIWRASVGPA